MKYCKHLFVTLIISMSLTFANNMISGNMSIIPSNKYDQYHSDTHPLSTQELTGMSQTAKIKITGIDTYTYVRCYYKLTNSQNKQNPDVATSYIWATNSNDSYYKLNGYWYADGLTEWKNMFYTATFETDIKAICVNSLKRENKGELIDIYAADNQLSFDHTIWQNSSPFNATKFDRVVGFGDSLSDTHNIYNASQWKLPNNASWFLGRFTNGPVWAEYLANNLNIPYYPWAIGGTETQTSHLVIPKFSAQVQSYKEYITQAKNYDPNKTLFTVWIGGNDFMKTDRSADEVIDNIDKSLHDLIKIGGKNIIILNLPDLSTAPVWKYKKDKDSTVVLKTTREFNAKLAETVAGIQNQYGNKINLRLFDAYAFFNKMMRNPEKYGINNIQDSCLDINEDNSSKYLTEQKRREICTDSNKFAFWDTLHPSTIIHKLLADEVTATLLTNPVDANPNDTPNIAAKDSIYVVNYASNNVSTVTLDNNSGTVTLPALKPVLAGNNPQKIIFDANKLFAYILNTGDDSISIYKVGTGSNLLTDSRAEIKGITNGKTPTDITLHNGYLYVASPDTNSIIIYKQNTTNGNLIRIGSQILYNDKNISIKPKSIIFKNNLAYILGYNSIWFSDIYAANGTLGNIHLAYELKTETNVLKFGTGLYSNFVFVLSTESKTISVLLLLSDGSLQLIQTTAMTYAPTNIELSKNGTIAFVTHGIFNNMTINKLSVLEIKPDGKMKLSNIINTRSEPSSVTLNSSGNHLLITNSGEASFSIYEILDKEPYLSYITNVSSGGYIPVAITTNPQF